METILWVLVGLFGLILYLSIGVGCVSIGKLIRNRMVKEGWNFKGIKVAEKEFSWSSAWTHTLFWLPEVMVLIMALLIAIAGAAFVIAAVFAVIVSIIGLIFFVVISSLLAVLALIYLVCSLIFSGTAMAFTIIVFMALCVIVAWLFFFLISGVLSIPETIGNLLTKGAPVPYEKKEKPENGDEDSFFEDSPPFSRVAE
ncbi:MAG: hypothetical protein UV40_C0040G0003 [Parcubacteria group bacterium GW2011_GWA1_42_7]|nr:MAG: hypothetical protein UV34_C0018G0006 [Parcubacteria group bacterium GW2011_GWB1_42_6]KKS68908.1 MAG: hypothetical protein UV40_C0040G0003 [Parcubacteria group bacterium GW2011_GWA1_42_7]KKS91542.1 MAG: hypothetical protein UV67_C0025G0006 [Parcubacteria group bacterium GW2011_GWC1_43_12]